MDASKRLLGRPGRPGRFFFIVVVLQSSGPALRWGAVHQRRGRAPKTPTLLDVLWVRRRLKLQNHERSLPRVLDSKLRVQRHQHVSLGVASCQSAILSLKKAAWRLWLVSKSRTKSSAEGCEQLLRRAASVARPPFSPSHARTARRRLQATREIPPAIRASSKCSLAQLPVNSSREGTTRRVSRFSFPTPGGPGIGHGGTALED